MIIDTIQSQTIWLECLIAVSFFLKGVARGGRWVAGAGRWVVGGRK